MSNIIDRSTLLEGSLPCLHRKGIPCLLPKPIFLRSSTLMAG